MSAFSQSQCMSLPNLTDLLNTNINLFLSWGTVQNVVTVIGGMAIGAMIFGLFLRVIGK